MGRLAVLADSIDGEPIGKVNFRPSRFKRPRLDHRLDPHQKLDARPANRSCRWLRRALHRGKFRIVADGFHFTNEIRFDAKEELLYVVETTGGRHQSSARSQDGSLRDREIFGPSSLGKGAWPDGIAFDGCGNLWGTMVYSDKLFVLTPQGELRMLLDEGDPKKVEALEQQFLKGVVTKDVLFATGQGIAPWMASVTFGGPDLRTLYIGSLKGQRIPYFQSPIAGLPMVHWSEANP